MSDAESLGGVSGNNAWWTNRLQAFHARVGGSSPPRWLKNYSVMKSILKHAREKGFYVTPDGKLIGIRGKVRSCCISPYGYYYTKITSPFTKKTNSCPLFVHQLQAFQKYGEEYLKKGIVARHLNGNSLDNRWENIAIGTDRDNMLDIPKEIRIKKSRKAAYHNGISYSIEKINAIKEDRRKGFSYKQLMEKYHISSTGTVSYICNHDYDYSDC